MKTLLILLIATNTYAQECIHPHLVNMKDGGAYIDCVETSALLDKLNTLSSIALNAGNAWDIESSLVNVVSGKNVVETNLFFQPLLENKHYALFAAIKTTEIYLLNRYLDDFYHSHPKMAIILKSSLASTFIIAAKHNSGLQ